MTLPGSEEAVKAGCTCPIIDNHYGAGFGGRYWMNEDCPIHGNKKEEMTEEQVKDDFDKGILELKKQLKERIAAIKKQCAVDTTIAFQDYDKDKAALWQAREQGLANILNKGEIK